MTDSKWADVLDKVESNFRIEDQGKYEVTEAPGGEVEFVVFESPLGMMRFERTVTPRVEDTRTQGGSKYGAGQNIQKVYSETETVNTFSAFKWDGSQWVEIEGEGLI